MPPGTNRLDVNAAAKASLQALATFEYLEPLLQVCKEVAKIDSALLTVHCTGSGRCGMTVGMAPALLVVACRMSWCAASPVELRAAWQLP